MQADDSGVEDYNLLYGPWLRASSPVKVGNFHGRRDDNKDGGMNENQDKVEENLVVPIPVNYNKKKAVSDTNIMEVESGLEENIESTSKEEGPISESSGGLENQNVMVLKTGKWKQWARDGAKPATGMDSNVQMVQLGFYGHPDVSQRCHSWNLLHRLQRISNLPGLCAGDFYEIVDAYEKLEGGEKPYSQMDGFRSVFDDCGLQDIGFVGPPYIWCNKREGQSMIQERLDRCVCDLRWQDLFRCTFVTHLKFWRLDHRPLLVDIRMMDQRITGIP
ncbi:hypothetical protein Dsin_024502 [Dipteronia sinensis]|uniref:Uncharacterized protein n=1 Tax=Dipteronia sinensis TaxID=43782 RepID=A0AAD9ZU43_9ROSI|nr:hypothetical protein Dsin_024502 [Dipteronia sinensis]